MIVLPSAVADIGRWMTEMRNILDDYRRLLGGGDSPRIAGVARMTDTDDTGKRGVAWYDAGFLARE